jgi:hypothetical protein
MFPRFATNPPVLKVPGQEASANVYKGEFEHNMDFELGKNVKAVTTGP